MGNMVTSFMVLTIRTCMRQLDITYSWKNLVGHVVDMGYILVLFEIGIVVIIAIIFT